jgi:hypothetical protein
MEGSQMSQPNVRFRNRGLYTTALVVSAIVLTAYLTHYFDQSQRPRWETVFEGNKNELTRIINGLKAGKYEVDREGRVSVPRKPSGICFVQQQDAFVFFTLTSDWLDDQNCSLVFHLDEGKPSTDGVRALFALLDGRPLYHIQYIEGGWYYCEYN